MKDLIDRQEAIGALDVGAELLRRVLDDADIVGAERAKYEWGLGLIESYIADVKALPSAQPDEEKISDILYNIYRNTSPHTSAEGVAATKYYIREIYREIYGEEGPRWMKK